MEIKKLVESFNSSRRNFINWKKQNVTIRGVKNLGSDNGVSGFLGKGLYVVPLSNKQMAKQYGTLYFVVNAIPKNPKIVQGLNSAEIFIQGLIIDYCKKNNQEYDSRFFYKNTSIEKEMVSKGFDGIIIKGREMVNYDPPKNVLYFKTEKELEDYYMENINRS
jgi:hypothetical protein